MVTNRYVMSGTHQGDFIGIPPTGNKFKGSGILIFRFKKKTGFIPYFCPNSLGDIWVIFVPHQGVNVG